MLSNRFKQGYLSHSLLECFPTMSTGIIYFPLFVEFGLLPEICKAVEDMEWL